MRKVDNKAPAAVTDEELREFAYFAAKLKREGIPSDHIRVDLRSNGALEFKPFVRGHRDELSKAA